MKSNAPWSVKGIERDARETAKEAAKREGMTVGEWLNQMIYSAGDPESSGGDVEGLKLRDLVTAIEHLNRRIANADATHSRAVEDINRNIGGAVERIQRLERVKPEEGTYEDLSARLARVEEAGGGKQRVEALKALEKAVAQVAVQFSTAQKASQERLDATEQQLQQLAARIDEGAGGDNDSIIFLKNTIDGLSARVARAEKIASEAAKLNSAATDSADPAFVENTGNRLRVLGDEIKRGGDQIKSMETVIAKLADQVEAAERRSSEGVQKVADTIAAVKDELAAGGDREELSAALAEARKDTDERIASLQQSFEEMIAKLSALGDGTAVLEREREDEAAFEGEDIGGADFESEDNETIPPEAFGFADVEETGDEREPIELNSGEAVEDLTPEQRVNDPAGEESPEEDPFAFADEIDDLEEDAEAQAGNAEAAVESETSDQETGQDDDAASGDDFSFDFDDEPPEQTGKVEPAQTAQEKAPAGEDELDAILADLDDMAGAQTADHETETTAPPPIASGPLGDLDAEESEIGEDEDYIKAARRKAKAAAEKREAEEAKRNAIRKKLTPKQRAILAARAKQKLKAKSQGDQTDAEEEERAGKTSSEPALSAPEGRKKDAPEESGEDPGRLAKIKGALTGITARFKKKDDDVDAAEGVAASSEEEAADPEIKSNGDRAAFNTLKSTAAARPVTLALTVAIILAIAALFFLVKDFVFKGNESAEQAAVTAPSHNGQTTPDADLPAVPAAPAIDPRELYLQAMGALDAASTDEETAAAMQTLQESAALGHPPAQLQLGEFYKTGQGVEQDLGQARTWFRRSANGGNVLAMHRIGVMTARGDGGPADSSEAIGWFELAANRGLVDSQYNLGAIYHPTDDGASAIQDAGKAFYWYSLAAKNGDEQAGSLAAGLSDQLTAEQREALSAEIEAWQAEASDPVANEVTPPSAAPSE